MRSHSPRTSASEAGFTLLEVVTTTTLLLVVVGSMLGFFRGLQENTAREVSRSETADQVRLAMDRMAKDIRQATEIHPGASATVLDMDTYVNGTIKRVIYDATGTNVLTRSVNGNSVVLLERMTITTVFTYAPDANDPSVITVSVTARPEKFSKDVAEISLTSEVQLRNR